MQVAFSVVNFLSFQSKETNNEPKYVVVRSTGLEAKQTKYQIPTLTFTSDTIYFCCCLGIFFWNIGVILPN